MGGARKRLLTTTGFSYPSSRDAYGLNSIQSIAKSSPQTCRTLSLFMCWSILLLLFELACNQSNLKDLGHSSISSYLNGMKDIILLWSTDIKGIRW